MKGEFPRTNVGGISVSRMIMGTNWLLGFSHTGPAADNQIRERYDTAEKIAPMLESCLKHGVDTIMSPFALAPNLLGAIRRVEDRAGKSIIMVDTPIINVDDNSNAREEARRVIRESARNGAKICLIHHACTEQLVDKNKGIINRIGNYTDMIRDAGMVPGLSAHMPEIVVYSDRNNYDVETYIQIYNCLGFMMQMEVEVIATIIHDSKKPVMTIKPMAAGRCTPFVGLSFCWNNIRDCDMVTVGCYQPNEVDEDVNISLAILERRFPDLGTRSSPHQKQAALGGK